MVIELSKIKVGNRQRCLYEDIEKLAASIKRYGLIQPIVLNQDNELIAGGRRLKAVTLLGWKEVTCCYKETLSFTQLAELELEENVRRNALTWQENCKAIRDIHLLITSNAAYTGELWGYEETGELLGKVKSNVWYAVTLGGLLDTDLELSKQPTMSDALRLLVSRKEKEAATLLVEKMRANPVVMSSPEAPTTAAPTIEASPSDYAVSHCGCANSLDYLETLPEASVDHIYTDPPYAIDMENLTQSNSGQATDRVAEQHQVEPNLQLLEAFLSRAHRVLKPTSFCVLWCDTEQWNWLSILAKTIGFSVCRWPLVWCKTDPCSNQMAYMNFTKRTELAMVLRMPEARLAQTCNTNYWIGGNDRVENDTIHPFWKPLALHMWILNAISLVGQTIVDPFAGEGSIPLACMKSQRNFIAIELVEIHYIQLIKNVNNTLKAMTNASNNSIPF